MADKGFDRRSFIKAAAGVGVAGLAGAATYGMIRPISDVNVEVVPISYPGIKVMEGSPAPYGLPLIPLELTGDGVLKGRVTDADQLKWYKYCSHEQAPGTMPDFESDNIIEYFVTEEKIAKGFDAWYKDLVGEPVRVADFPDSEPLEKFEEFPGVGAAFRWRSEGVESEDVITGIVIRTPRDELSFGPRITAEQEQTMMDQWFPADPEDPDYVYVASCSFCTHFCCVPGFHEADLAISSGYGKTIFCTCHLSRYDPFTIETYDRTIFLFPDGEDGGEARTDETTGSGGGH